MSREVIVNPLQRQNGVARVAVKVEGDRIVDATVATTYFRGFEEILTGRAPEDAVMLTERVCGICSIAHGLAAAYAVEDAYGFAPPTNGLLLRNLIFAADLLQNHIRHFYLLSLPDWVDLPPEPPLVPRQKIDYRLGRAETDRVVKDYFDAYHVSRRCHSLVVTLGARAPHQQAMWAGGVTLRPTVQVIDNAWALLSEAATFVRERMLPDAKALAAAYSDYHEIGVTRTNLLSYGMFRKPGRRSETYFPSGAVLGGEREEVDEGAITEDTAYSYYRDDRQTRPPREGITDPAFRPEAYSWTKAPRYRGEAMQGGPIARLWLAGTYTRGMGTMDRIVTRAMEAVQVSRWAEDWLKALQLNEPAFAPPEAKPAAEGRGMHDAMRGPLGHWLRIRNSRIDHYQIITPSAWNMSPRDARKRVGLMEEALIGSPLADPENPVEIGRIIRSFDPCSACSVHVISADRYLGEFHV